MQLSDIIIGGTAIAASVAVKEIGQSPEWVSFGIAAFTGSGLAAGFRMLDGQIKGWRAGVLSLIAGATGGYFFAGAVVQVAKLDAGLAIPLTFFSSIVLAGAIRSFATRLDFDRAADAIEDRISDGAKKP